MNRCKCGSYAVNDDPERMLCDKCWRDATIERLRAALWKIANYDEWPYGDYTKAYGPIPKRPLRRQGVNNDN